MRSFVLAIFLILIVCMISFGQESSPLKILERPIPVALPNAGAIDVQGGVILRVSFLANGTIGDVRVVKGLSFRNLTELAVNAAKLIKFEPEIVNGQPVTKIRQLQYIYVYGGWQRPENSGTASTALTANPVYDDKAESILKKAVQTLGGDRYLQVRSQVGRGKFSVIRGGAVVSFQTFVDVLVFPDKERTDFKGGGSRTVQTNTGNTGWVFDGDQDLIRLQTEKQIANFRQGIRTSLDNLLRGTWKGEADLSYVGKRPATLGKRNEVVKLTYQDGFTVEFEFAADDGLPQKALYKRTDGDGEEIKEEDRYAQFIEIDGVKTPFIVDRFSGGTPSSRINYESIEFNKKIPDSIFTKPSSPKEAKKDLKY